MSIEACMKQIEHQDISNDASISTDLSTNPLYMVQYRNIVPATDNTNLEFTGNAFSADYRYHRGSTASGSTSYAASVTNSAAYILFHDDLGSNTGESASGKIFIPNPSSSSLYKPIFGHGTAIDQGVLCRHITYTGYYSGATTAFTSATLAMSAGNLSTGSIDTFGLALYEVGDIGKSYNNCTYISRTIISNDAAVDITLSGSYSHWVVVLINGRSTDDGDGIGARVGTSGGVKTSNTPGYFNNCESGASTFAGDYLETALSWVGDIGTASGENHNQFAVIPNTSGKYKIVSTMGGCTSNDGNSQLCNCAGAYTGDTDALTTYRLFSWSNNVDTGTAYLYGIS